MLVVVVVQEQPQEAEEREAEEPPKTQAQHTLEPQTLAVVAVLVGMRLFLVPEVRGS